VKSRKWLPWAPGRVHLQSHLLQFLEAFSCPTFCLHGTTRFSSDWLLFVVTLRLANIRQNNGHFTRRPTCVNVIGQYNWDRLCSLWVTKWGLRNEGLSEQACRLRKKYRKYYLTNVIRNVKIISLHSWGKCRKPDISPLLENKTSIYSLSTFTENRLVGLGCGGEWTKAPKLLRPGDIF
jgi:hypothetical protein